MKRYIISILVLVLMAVGLVSSLFYIKGVTDTLHEIADTAIQFAQKEDYEQTKACLVQLRDTWMQHEAIFTLFVRHDHIDLLTDPLAKLMIYVEYENFEEVEAYLETILYQLENVWSSELPTFTNVF